MQRRIAQRDVRAAVDHHDAGRLVGVACDDLIEADRGDRDHAARRGDRVGGAGHEVAHVQVDGALRLCHRERRVVERVDVGLGRLVEHQLDVAEPDGRVGARFGPERVAGGDRVVERGELPLGRIGGVERDRSGQGGEPANPGGRVGRLACVRGGARRRGVLGVSGRRQGRAGHQPPDRQRGAETKKRLCWTHRTFSSSVWGADPSRMTMPCRPG